MAATIADVARLAGVSPGTVSNVMNRPQLVLEATRLRVEQAMAELEFVPNRQARVLAGGLNRGIGLVIHDVGNPFFSQVADSVDDVATAHGYGIVLTSSRASLDRQEASLRMFAEQRLSGVLLAPTVEGPTTAAKLRERGMSVVLLDYPGGIDECSVTVDDVSGGAIAARHLLGLGRTRLAFVGGPSRVRQHADRLEGMRAAVKAHDSKATVAVTSVAAHTVACGAQAAAKLVKQRRRPDAVFCGNDLIAVGLVGELGRLGVRVPDDIAVVGYDDIELAALVGVPLTSVRQPMDEIGRVATQLLLAEIAGGQHTHQQLRFEPRLIIRSSTGAAS